MSTLDKIPDRMGPDEQTKFLKIVRECNMAPDSPDLIQAYLASSAMSAILDGLAVERKAFEEAMNDLPTVIRLVGTDVAMAIGDNISKNIKESVVRDASTILHDLKDSINACLVAGGNKVLDSLDRYIDTAKNVVSHANTRIGSTVERYSGQVRDLARSMEKCLGSLVIMAFIIGLVLGAIGGGVT